MHYRYAQARSRFRAPDDGGAIRLLELGFGGPAIPQVIDANDTGGRGGIAVARVIVHVQSAVRPELEIQGGVQRNARDHLLLPGDGGSVFVEGEGGELVIIPVEIG